MPHGSICPTSATCSAGGGFETGLLARRDGARGERRRRVGGDEPLRHRSRWLIDLPPTMSPVETSAAPGLLEHPAEAFAYFRRQGVARVVCQEKHMGSRLCAVVCRDAQAAQSRFGTGAEVSAARSTRARAGPSSTMRRSRRRCSNGYARRPRRLASGSASSPTGCCSTASCCPGRRKRAACCASSTAPTGCWRWSPPPSRRCGRRRLRMRC